MHRSLFFANCPQAMLLAGSPSHPAGCHSERPEAKPQGAEESAVAFPHSGYIGIACFEDRSKSLHPL